jgi:hypothetical protein
MFSGIPYFPGFSEGPVLFPFPKDPVLIGRILRSTLIGGGLGILTEKLIQRFCEEEGLNESDPNFIDVIKANVFRVLGISGAAYGVNVASAITSPVVSHLITTNGLTFAFVLAVGGIISLEKWFKKNQEASLRRYEVATLHAKKVLGDKIGRDVTSVIGRFI